MRSLKISPDGYRRLTLVVVITFAFLIVTGGAVRLTGSGLGCPEWPHCAEDRLLPPKSYHAQVEFLNRVVTGVLAAAASGAAVIGARLRRPRRKDLFRLSLGLVVGTLANAALGGLMVRIDLEPLAVMSHFLLAMAVLANAVVLHWRAGRDEERRPVDDPTIRQLGHLILGTAAFLILLGTVVTGAGPHGGDETAERFDIPLGRAAQLHGMTAMLFLAMVVTMVVLLGRAEAREADRRRALAVLAVIVGQATVGYVQYFNGVPVVLVGIHIAGATLLWATVLRFHMGLRQGPSGEAAVPERSSEALVGA